MLTLGEAGKPSYAEHKEQRMHKTKQEQWQNLQFGLFIHFGLYSLLGGVWKGKRITRGYSEQILSHGYLPQGDYEALTGQFSLPLFDADHIVSVAKQAGMQYVVLSAKHHDGFCLFDTKTTDYSSNHAACSLDVVREVRNACTKYDMQFGIYFSWIDWHFPEAMPISSHNSDPIVPAHQNLNIAQLTELLSNYGNICELWMDMGFPTAAQSEQVRDLVSRLQPQCMINGRIWNDCQDFLTMGDNELPSVRLDCPWQTPASIYKETWGYRSWQERGDDATKIAELSQTARSVVQQGGNYLLNIGLTGDGSIQEFEERVLLGIGKALAEQPLRRQDRRIQVAVQPFIHEQLDTGRGEGLYRYTGSDYYSYHPILTSLSWAVSVSEDTWVSLSWMSEQPLKQEQKLGFLLDGKTSYHSLQANRSGDSLTDRVLLTKGEHMLCLHTVGEPLKRTEILEPNLHIILQKEGTV
ncbi:alpha-L-fucosidase [Sphaerochaeta sp.]|uniref:alpha-L-fucosidase n=1 Tax=Sphaerochaeta sp. TaxID=1972642 RepID=UPI003FA7C8EF